MEDEEKKPPVSTQPFLVLAVALTAVGCVIVLVDLYAPRDTIPQTLVNLSMVVMASCWNIYFVWTALQRVDERMRNARNSEDYVRGYVDGIGRRPPESDTVRLVHSAS